MVSVGFPETFAISTEHLFAAMVENTALIGCFLCLLDMLTKLLKMKVRTH